MPLYEYQCSNCKESFEKLVRFSEADQTPACPVCGEGKTQKKIPAVASFSVSDGNLSSGTCAPGSRYT